VAHKYIKRCGSLSHPGNSQLGRHPLWLSCFNDCQCAC